MNKTYGGMRRGRGSANAIGAGGGGGGGGGGGSGGGGHPNASGPGGPEGPGSARHEGRGGAYVVPPRVVTTALGIMASPLPRGVPIGLTRETITLQVPVEISEFENVVQTLLTEYFYPTLKNLPADIDEAVLNELFSKLDTLIGDKFVTYVLQLSSRTMPPEIVFNVSEYEEFIRQILRLPPHESVRATIEEMALEEQRLVPLRGNVQMSYEPSRFERLRAFITGTPLAPTGILTSLDGYRAHMAAAAAAGAAGAAAAGAGAAGAAAAGAAGAAGAAAGAAA